MTDYHSSPLVSICSGIGRGHPAYLDSIMAALNDLPGQKPVIVSRNRCYDLENGVSGLSWRAVGQGYNLGAAGGVATWLYNRLRSSGARPSSLQLSLLGRDLRREMAGYQGICLVDHPLLAHILARTCRVAYLHAEIAAPRLSAVPEAWRTFVPVEHTAARLESFGVKRDAVAVTGLVVEPELVPSAETAFRDRLSRLASGSPLTIGLFISGAFPRPHTNSILAATSSLVLAGHRAILFWGTGWLRAAKIRNALTKLGVPEAQARLVWANSRQAATTRAVELVPDLDLMVAAAHERTSWAVGLGLPMFALLPNIGPFARENFTFALEQGVCLPIKHIDDAREFGLRLDQLRREGRLEEMCRSGFGRYSITGAENTARRLLAAL